MIGYLVLMLSVFLTDFFTKKWALINCTEEIIFNRLISCKVVFNRGVVWSLFHSTSRVPFFFVTAAVLAVLIFLAFYTVKRYRKSLPVYGEVLILSGGLMNVLDRFIYGGVVDFIVLSYKNYSWPVFNFADAAIFFGVLVMLGFFRRKK